MWLLTLFLLHATWFSGSEGVSNSTPAATDTGTVVNVGAIFTFDTIIGRVAKIALKAAEDDINSDPILLGGRKLSITMHDSNYSGFLGIIGALQFMETDTVAIIGPQSSVMAHTLSHLANELHVPLLSCAALDPMLSPLQYPYFVQTAPSDLFQMTAIADMISYFGWGEVVAVFSDDDANRNGVTVLGDKLAERRCKISYKAVLPPGRTATPSDVEGELVKVLRMESRVIVLSTNYKTGLLVFQVAQGLGMMKEGFVWIATSWLSTVLDSTSPLPPDASISFRGALTLRPHTSGSERKLEFKSRWNKLSNGSVGLNPYGLYYYDTVWMLARAVKLFLDEGNSITFSSDAQLSGPGNGTLNLSALSIFDGGPQLLENILRTNMTGLTGPIRFNSDRSVLNPSFDIINAAKTGFHQIGYWSNYSGLSVVPPETLYEKPPNRSSSNQHLDLNAMIWPGGAKAKPRGWVFPDNGRKLRIGVPNRASFKDFVSKNGSDAVNGYCIEVFIATINLLPYAVPYKFIPFGDGHNNPNYTELVNQITTGVFDAAVGDIAIITDRSRVADFTQPYIDSGLVVVAPAKKLNTSAWAFLRPFTPLMWAITAVFFLVVGAVVWILEHRTNDEFRGPPRKQIATILWFSFSTMFFSHRENTVSTLGRLVLIIWLFVVLIINSSYTASLTSILTVQQLSSPIRGIDTLAASEERIGFQVGSFAENYLIEELNVAKSRLVALGSPEQYMQALVNGTVAAVVDERAYVELFLSEHCEFSIRGQDFTKNGWGFAFPRGSPLAVDMSTAILALSENGGLQKIHDRWLAKKRCSSGESGSETHQLELESFKGLFLLCGIACFLALLIYFWMMIREFKMHKDDEGSDDGLMRGRSSRSTSTTSGQMQRFFSFADDKVEQWKRKSSKRKRGDVLELDFTENGSERTVREISED